jgi:hypothetical protein
LAGLLLLIGGCATSSEPYLRWHNGPPSGRLQGKVAIKQVPNLRPAGRGEGRLADIGRERTSAGVTAIVLEGDQNVSLDQSIMRLTIDAMLAAGLATTQPEDGTATAHLNIEIHNFWCDSARSAKADVTVELVLLDPPSGAERLRVPVTGTGAAPECRAAFAIALNEVYKGLVSAFVEAEVHAAALGPPAGTPEPAATSVVAPETAAPK